MSLAQEALAKTSDPHWEGVFPLPLTPMEAFLLADGRPGYPLMCDIRLEFDGVLDRDIFSAALTGALTRNPLFCSIIGRDPKLGPVWLPTDQLPLLDWAATGTPLGDRYDELIDLAKQIGLRVWVRHCDRKSSVLLHFHHACSDALGTFAFIEDLLALYSTLCPDGPAIALRPLEPARLRVRGLASIPKRRWYHHPFDLLFGIREGLRFFWTAPKPLLAPNSSTDSSATGREATPRAEMISRSLAPELTARLREVASQAGVTVNDVLLSAMFVALAHWNAQQGGGTAGKWLRILMPQNLRAAEDDATPTANIMSFAFLTRRARQCQSVAAVLPKLHRETELIRKHRLSVFFLGSLASALSAGVLEKLLNSKICFSTVVLSNFGRPLRRFVAQFPQVTQGLTVGNTVLRSLTGVPPLRPGTRAAFAVIGSADDLTLTVKCDPQHFGPIDAARLLDEYVSQVVAAAGGAGR